MARTRYVVVRNKRGEHKVVDTVKVRMGRMRDRVFSWARIMQSGGQGKRRLAMFTLTYDTKGTLIGAHDWQAGQIRQFMKRLRKRLKDRLHAYAWVAELHYSGKVHYHVLVLYTGWLPYPDKEYHKRGLGYKRLWDYGLASTELRVRTPFYICTYVGKEYQKDFEKFPAGCQAWSVWFSDKVLKEALRFNSLDEIAQGLVKAFGWSIGLAEYPDVRRELDCEGWQYIGSFLQRHVADFMAGGELEVEAYMV